MFSLQDEQFLPFLIDVLSFTLQCFLLSNSPFLFYTINCFKLYFPVLISLQFFPTYSPFPMQLPPFLFSPCHSHCSTSWLMSLVSICSVLLFIFSSSVGWYFSITWPLIFLRSLMVCYIQYWIIELAETVNLRHLIPSFNFWIYFVTKRPLMTTSFPIRSSFNLLYSFIAFICV